MKLSHDEINTVTLLLERKPKELWSCRDSILYSRLCAYWKNSIGIKRVEVDFDKLNEEERKDQEEERDGRYR